MSTWSSRQLSCTWPEQSPNPKFSHQQILLTSRVFNLINKSLTPSYSSIKHLWERIWNNTRNCTNFFLSILDATTIWCQIKSILLEIHQLILVILTLLHKVSHQPSLSIFCKYTCCSHPCDNLHVSKSNYFLQLKAYNTSNLGYISITSDNSFNPR